MLGSIHIDLGPDTGGIVRVLQADAERRGIAYAAEGTYANPLELQNTARDIITRIKEAGVTTVVFTGDPLAPATLTKVATEQGWFPEWIVTGTALIDTAVLPRNYDQRQWAQRVGLGQPLHRSRRRLQRGDAALDVVVRRGHTPAGNLGLAGARRTADLPDRCARHWSRSHTGSLS